MDRSENWKSQTEFNWIWQSFHPDFISNDNMDMVYYEWIRVYDVNYLFIVYLLFIINSLYINLILIYFSFIN